ncbi:hypothetical protein KIN20_032436 [Parelaphostrongylus tenuis]|uniref:G-protein coupled receptors family 1 profile domain-containing protein n=1 Tax=Parelaphostrongylus tenuis TaxID=148309 RepID=A0AAD5WI23_PARTN|nr:hypothetical protein KIN20_032436 [Parelaphostrongylus tenuis]
MDPQIISIAYQVFYIVIPTINIIGNTSIVYVTVRAKSLRSICNIFIALISVGEILFGFAPFVMIVSYHIYTIDKAYRKPYMAIEILLALLYPLAIVAWIFDQRTETEAQYAICGIESYTKQQDD